MPALGERFRAAREARGLTLSEVSEQLRIRAIYLGAIEEENWGTIGAPVYARGFIRTYARFLGLDPEESVAAFNASSGSAPAASAPAAAADASAPRPEPPQRGLAPLIWIASAVAALLVAYVVYNAVTLHQPASPAVTAEASAAPSTALPSNGPSNGPAPAALPSPSASPASSTNALELHLTAASWMRVVVDGGASIEGTFPAGTVKSFRGKIAVVRVGNAGGVEAFVDGKSVGVLGKTGDVVERTFTL